MLYKPRMAPKASGVTHLVYKHPQTYPTGALMEYDICQLLDIE